MHNTGGYIYRYIDEKIGIICDPVALCFIFVYDVQMIYNKKQTIVTVF